MKIKSFWNHLSLKRKVLTTFLPLTMIPLLIILIISITLITQNGKKDARQKKPCKSTERLRDVR